MAMPMLYNSEVCSTQAMGKLCLTRAYRRAVLNCLREQHGGKMKALDVPRLQRLWRPLMSHDVLVPFWPTRDAAEGEARDYVRAKLYSEGSKLSGLTALAPLPDEPLPAAQVASEDEWSSSASGTSSEDKSVASVDDTFCFTFTSRRKGAMHLCSLAGIADETECGRRLRDPEFGSGLEEAVASGRTWSPRCYARLPSDLQAAFRP